MRLNKLILHGFKSFADRTEFSFDAPITGIVGPNGCGKSNVVDAFKWVLGEQSAKSLRGDAMLDVIFNGSGARKPAGLAEVTLVFDNPRKEGGARSLNIELDEVSVGRRLYRDGTSEYQISGQTARLKDVRELFLDTGVGVDAYSVIEQGRVAALLDANPQERRLIFEEAAGISKFKQRKKEAQRKLERVDQNLLRANDVVEEVERRLRGVKAQATRARTFQEYSQRLSEMRLSQALHDYHILKAKLTELEGSRQEGEFRLDDANGDLQHAQNELAELRISLTALSDRKQELERNLTQARMAVHSAQQKQQYARQQGAQLAEQLAGFVEDKNQLAAKMVALNESLEAEKVNLQKLTEEADAHRGMIDQRQAAYGECQIRLASLDQERERVKGQILEVLRQLAGVNSRLGAVEIESKNVAQQQQRISERQRVVAEELSQLEKVQTDLQRKLDQTSALMNEQQRQLEEKRAAAQALGRQIAQISEQLGAAREHRCGLDSRQKVLEDLEARREGVSEGVQSVLRQRKEKFPFVRGLVADVLQVDIADAQVVEAALDGRDQWLVTEDSSAVAAAREALLELEGRVTLLCSDALPAEGTEIELPAGARLALNLVRYAMEDAAVARALLGRTLVVEDLPSAAALRRSGAPGLRYVTRAGEVLEADGTLKAGPFTAGMGLISRRSELVAIAQQIAEVDDRIGRLSRKLTDDNTAARGLEDEIGVLRNALYQSNTVKVQTSGALAQNADSLSVRRRERPLLESELENLQQTAGQLKSEHAELSERREALETEQTQQHAQVEELTGSQRQASDQLRELGEGLTSARVQLGQAQEKQLASRQAVGRQGSQQAEMGQQLERVAQSAASVAGRQRSVERELASAVAEEASVGQTLSELQGKMEEAGAELAQRSASAEELTGRVESLRSTRQEIEQEMHKLDVAASEENVRLQSLVQRATEEMGLDVAARYEEMNSNGNSYQSGDLNFEEVAATIKDLREKIGRLGNVNVEAIGELAELEEREKFLSGQLNDLIESKRQLTEMIDEINRESGARFEVTFNAVREHFQGMFRKLFGGGKADVCLETELEPVSPGVNPETGEPLPAPPPIDVLDAGIEIIARPPGKQPVSISQLSGGEKTMTCVALLMSIFKSKPSPFCILDEVDAALDEANNERFNAVVVEFLELSQFIVITHSKRTMRIAGQLYGVTMQEQGVSKRVAVKFDEVDAHGRIAKSATAAPVPDRVEVQIHVVKAPAADVAESAETAAA